MAIMGNLSMDAKYHECVKAKSLAEFFMFVARRRIHDDFIRLCRPAVSDTILDVGVSDVMEDTANTFERLYPYHEKVTATGLGEGRNIRMLFPDINYVQVSPGEPLPFDNKSFDIVVSNAVLEHTGGHSERNLFVKELLRVACTVFITVPNRYFFVEHHTAIPFLHFFDTTFHLACKMTNKIHWASERNLILTSKKMLSTHMPDGMHVHICYTGLPLGLFSSNLYLHARPGKKRIPQGRIQA